MFKRLDQHEILAPQTCTFFQRIENAQGETSRLQIYGHRRNCRHSEYPYLKYTGNLTSFFCHNFGDD